jgi:hypothetical protein
LMRCAKRSFAGTSQPPWVKYSFCVCSRSSNEILTAVPHRTREDYIYERGGGLEPLLIPKDSLVIPNIWSVTHHDQNIKPNLHHDPGKWPTIQSAMQILWLLTRPGSLGQMARNLNRILRAFVSDTGVGKPQPSKSHILFIDSIFDAVFVQVKKVLW